MACRGKWSRKVRPPDHDRLDTFDRQCDALTTTDAHRDQPAFAACALKLVHRFDRDDRTRGPNRMTQRNCAAIRVYAGRIKTKFLCDGKCLGCKRFASRNRSGKLSM